jgi:hypothetical protein
LDSIDIGEAQMCRITELLQLLEDDKRAREVPEQGSAVKVDRDIDDKTSFGGSGNERVDDDDDKAQDESSDFASTIEIDDNSVRSVP